MNNGHNFHVMHLFSCYCYHVIIPCPEISEYIHAYREEAQSAVKMRVFRLVKPHFDTGGNERLIPVVNHSEL